MSRTHTTQSGSTPRRGLAAALLMLAVAWPTQALAADTSLESARAELSQDNAQRRLAAVAQLAEAGTMDDVPALVARLHDDDESVRTAATDALWRVWSRSGDAQVDALLAQGNEQMQAWQFDDALTTFTEVTRRRPDFAEGWNKRATVLFLMGRHEASLRDCDEVFARNALHFGAWSGAGRIHAELGQVQAAIDAYRRALAINPNLSGPAASLRILEEQQREVERGKI
ncbi:MAG: tetratricopeptide repeat protein [Rubrivivax sp.]